MIFEREERYIVVKISHLSEDQRTKLCNCMEILNIDELECVVVEPDWPIYDRVWGMIEDQWVSENMDATMGYLKDPDMKNPDNTPRLRALVTEAREYVEAIHAASSTLAIAGSAHVALSAQDLMARIDKAVAETARPVSDGIDSSLDAQPLDLDGFPIVGDVKITGGDKSEEPVPFTDLPDDRKPKLDIAKRNPLHDPFTPIPGHYWSEVDMEWKLWNGSPNLRSLNRPREPFRA